MNPKELFAILLVFLLFTGCYLEGVSDNRVLENTIVLDLVNQAPVGFAGTGYYLKARIYKAEDVDAMLSQGTIFVDTIETNTIDYDPVLLSTPLNTQAFFLGSQPPTTGLVILVDLPPDEYRVLLERLEYWQGDGESGPYAAGLTDSFNVVGGENTDTAVQMLTHLSNT